MPVDARPPRAPELPFWKRLAWLIAIWAASVSAVFALSLLLRFWLKP